MRAFVLQDTSYNVPLKANSTTTKIVLAAHLIDICPVAGTLIADWYPLTDDCEKPEQVVNIYFDPNLLDTGADATKVPSNKPPDQPIFQFSTNVWCHGLTKDSSPTFRTVVKLISDEGISQSRRTGSLQWYPWDRYFAEFSLFALLNSTNASVGIITAAPLGSPINFNVKLDGKASQNTDMGLHIRLDVMRSAAVQLLVIVIVFANWLASIAFLWLTVASLWPKTVVKEMFMISLKAADCGVAMGEGSDVAKEAADLVLLGEFSSIITAIEYGRLVYDNLKKTILYLLPAGSFSELMPIVFNVVFGLPQILSNIQMIIICVAVRVRLTICFMCYLTMLCTRRMFFLPYVFAWNHQNTDSYLENQGTLRPTDRLTNWRLLLQAYGFLGILESLCAMSMSFWFLQRNGVPFSQMFLSFQPLPGDYLPSLTSDLYNQATSVYFFTLVIMQWGNLLATRGRKLSIFQHTPKRNLYIFGAMPISLLLAIFFSYIPWFQVVFKTSGIPVEHFFIPVAFAFGLLLLDEVRKLLVRKYPKSFVGWLAW